MLFKVASMFLANIYYYFIFFQKKSEMDDFRIFGYLKKLRYLFTINKIYDIYFKIHGSLTDLKLRHSVNKLIIFLKFLEYYSLLVRQYQNIILVTLNKFVNFID